MTDADRKPPPAPQDADERSSGVPLDRLVHGAVERLTAIRNYAAAARRALASGSLGYADYALLQIDEQVRSAHDVLKEVRRNHSARS